MFGEPIGRWWMLAGLRKDLSDLNEGSFYVFGAPDGSAILNPRVDISMAQNAQLTVFGGLTMGNDEGVLGAGLYSVVSRLTVYF